MRVNLKADSVSHQAALRITPPEWAALASLDAPGGLTREGYIGLLVLLRAAAVQRSYTQREPAPAPFDDQPGARTSQVGEPPASVHEPQEPEYPPRRRR